MDNIHKLNQIILDSLPHWAMLINVTNRTVLAANKLALEGGANINCQCWDDFGHKQFISDEHKKLIKIEPERKRDNQIKCDFCLADEAMESGKPERKEVEIEGTIWDTWWVPVDEDTYLHYAMDITEIRRTQKDLEEAHKEVKTLKGMIPICSSCKNIRDDKGYWSKIESYIESHSDAQFTHGLCEKCMEGLYGDQEWYKKRNKKSN
jgi:hypothetical protein